MSANEQLSAEEESGASPSEASSTADASAEEASPEVPSEPPQAEANAESAPVAAAPEGEKELNASQVWGDGSEGSSESEMPSGGERRFSARKGVRLNKLISAQLHSPNGPVHVYLHLVDISEGGMRVNGDIELADDGPFEMTLQTEPFGPELASEYPELTVKCRVVWQKRLLGGMFVSGLQFLDKSELLETALRRILELCSPEGRRLRFRLNRVLGVGIGLDEQTRWLYPLALDLSVEGMRVRLDEPLKVGETFPLQIFLEFDLPTVQMSAEVVWKEEIGPSRFQVGLRFHDLNEANAEAIQNYIDRCLAKELK